MADQAFGAQAFGANKWGGIQLFVFDDTGADYAATGALLLAGGHRYRVQLHLMGYQQ